MATFGNVIWFLVIGWWTPLLWLLIAGIFAITIIGLPLARACLEFAKLTAFPFGKEIIRDTELLGKNNVSAVSKTINIILGIVWFPFGLILTISYFALAIIFFVSIVGIPFGIAFVRIGRFVLFPMGAHIVNKKQAYAIATANEMTKRTNTAEVQTGNNSTANNTQLVSAVAFPKEKVMAIVVGTLVCFLLFRFSIPRNPSAISNPFFNGEVLALSIISVAAIIFGGSTGWGIGALGYTLAFIFWGFNPFWVYFFNFSIPYIIGYGLFGLLAGIICQKLVLSKKENSILKNIVLIFLITFVLGVLTVFIRYFLYAVINIIRNIPSGHLGSNAKIFFRTFLHSYLQRGLPDSLKGGIATGIISSLSIFAWLKWCMKKAISPVEEAKQPEQNTQDTVQ